MHLRTRDIRVGAIVLALGAVALGAVWAGRPDPAGNVGPRGDAASLADSSLLAGRETPLVALAVDGAERLIFEPVVVTGYASRAAHTDSTPGLTATMTRVRPGCIALSRDLLRTFTPDAPFDFGDCVVIPDVGVFSVEDTMHPRWTRRADIWFANTRQALHWGRREALIARLPDAVDPTSTLFAFGPQVREFARLDLH